MKEIPAKRIAAIRGSLQYATPRQREICEAYLELGTMGASKELGIAYRYVQKAVLTVIKKGQQKGFSPEHGVDSPPMPDFVNKRISTMRKTVDEDGNTKLQWTIQERDKEAIAQAMQETSERLTENLPAYPKIKTIKTKPLNKDLMNMYTIADYHFGMLAWHEEGGADWDVNIAKSVLIKTFQYLIENSPDSETGLFCNLGDFMHYDGWLPVTPASGHILDTDGRFPKIVDAAVDSMLEVIGMLLQKHKKVIVVNCQGNHDLASSYWLQKICEKVFQNNAVEFNQGQIVQVEKQVLPYHAVGFGKTALYFHHGHKRKFAQQSLVFANQFPELWSQAKYRYGHTGHLHHSQRKEDWGIVMEQHNTMAARDAYASTGGWFSERSTNVITYHKEFGEVGRNYVKPCML